MIQYDVVREGAIFHVEISHYDEEDRPCFETDKGSAVIMGTDQRIGDTLRVEVYEKANTRLYCVPADRPALNELYESGTTHTISIDRIENGDGISPLDFGRQIRVLEHDLTTENLPVTIKEVSGDEVVANRLVEISNLSKTSLYNSQHPDNVVVRFDNVSLSEWNVFLSHLAVAGDLSRVQKLVDLRADGSDVNLKTATQLLQSGVEIGPETWLDILFIVSHRLPNLRESILVEYLASCVVSEAIPEAWRSAVISNINLICSEHEVEVSNSDISSRTDKPTVSTTLINTKTREKEYHDSYFSTQVRDAWENRCAICESEMTAVSGVSGLDAAHIYPVAYGGPDSQENILALCKLHHWAFDAGWITVGDNYHPIVREETPADVRRLISVDSEERLLIPSGFEPDPEYLSLHRRMAVAQNGSHSVMVGLAMSLSRS